MVARGKSHIESYSGWNPSLQNKILENFLLIFFQVYIGLHELSVCCNKFVRLF